MCFQSNCEEDAEEATGAESSSDEGEHVGPESSNDETDKEASGSSDEEEEVAPPAPSSGRPRSRRRRALNKKSRVDEVRGEWKKRGHLDVSFSNHSKCIGQKCAIDTCKITRAVS